MSALRVEQEEAEERSFLGYQVARDEMQDLLVDYSDELSYQRLSEEAIHATKVRVIDTLGALLGGFFGEPCRLARNLASKVSQSDGATLIGTRHKTTPDLAAFTNATTARYVEMNDVYHWPGSSGGHPSDVLTPVLAAAEHAHASGEDFITAVVLAYEVYLRFADATKIPGFDSSTFGCLGVSLGSAKVMGLSKQQIHHACSAAIVPHNALNQARSGHLSMWKAVAAGQAGRDGVFAALLASEDFAGPHLPFAGKDGWFDHVARNRFTVPLLGGDGVSFKVEDSLIKQRSSCATTISSILAAEAAFAKLQSAEQISRVLVEVYSKAKEGMATGEHHWNPTNRETADHSIPYVVAAALHDGTVTPHQFDDAHLADPEIRAILAKIEVVPNDDFTKEYERLPVVHRTRVTVEMKDGERVTGESGAELGDLSNPKSDDDISNKFTALTQEYLGARRVRHFLDRLWSLEEMTDVAEIPPLLVM